MRDLFKSVLKTLEEGKDAVLVTIIASSGSTPRGAGSRMLVRADGTTEGTIGGGAVEHRSIEMALKAIKEKASYTHGFVLGKEQVADLGMICGGNVVVYFQYIDHESEGFKKLCQRAIETYDKDEDSWLIMDITDETAWAMGVYSSLEGLVGLEGMDKDSLSELLLNRAVQKQWNERSYYSEPLVRAGSVYVFGGGHVAQELVPVLAHVGFRCVVFDDRTEFANSKVFPQAETIVGDFERIFDYVNIRESDYVCIMTRGHQFDYLVQKQILTKNACYVGVMGSRKKLETLNGKLLEDGFSKEKLESCHSPIGTKILAETPAEIAISIAGELILTRAIREGRKKKG